MDIAPQQYSIAAGELGDALNQLAAQSQMQISYAPELVQGKTAPAISGHMTWREALDRLLAGNGLEYSVVGQNLVAIRKSGPHHPRTAPRSSGDGPRAVPSPPPASKPTTLQSITVLGSLLPRTRIETASPLVVISAEDIKNHGFSSVADALQNLSFNTGASSNNGLNAGTTGQSKPWATKTVSLFGLDPSYTKFLINGRPMPTSSQIAESNNSDELYNNLSGIPIDMVERIEVLPGAQSSLYGSDAIAGVINIVLKKHVQFGTLDARYGWYSDGGGRERMVSASDSFEIGKLSLMVGAQVNDQQPMWDFQRKVTAQNYAGGISPQQATTNIYALGYSGATYLPTQPSDCGKLTGLWGGSERYYLDPVYGPYCGSVKTEAYNTLLNKDRNASLSVHADYAVNDDVNLYADLLYNYEEQAHALDKLFAPIIYDPNLDDDVIIWRQFAPEEISHSLDGLLTQRNYENTYTATIGGKVDFGAGWDLDVGFTRAYERSDERSSEMLATGIPGSYGNTVLGPQLGTSADGSPIYSPNYSLLATPLTPEQFAGYLGAGSNRSTDRNDQLRAQLTQSSLFTLPGGDAGLALVVEKGYETWKYLPSPAFTSGELYGVAFAFNPSEGHRNRYATAAELNLPLFKMLTADLSGRYDAYDAEGARFSKPTYSLGLEFRPFDSLLLRGRYATSFKAPSLTDEFEGGSTSQSFATDWVNCSRLGFTGANIGNCPYQYADEPITLMQTSNPHLQPMTAKSWSYGVVWSPTTSLSMNLDYQHTSIRNEVLQEYADYLLQTQLDCENGTLEPSSPTCKAANEQITRDPVPPGSPLLGRIRSVAATKINIAHELNNSVIAGLDYRLDAGAYGRFGLHLAYTRVLTHRQQQFPGDEEIDFLNSPGFFRTEFGTKANASLTWSRRKWDVTLYGTYFGPTPNFAAANSNSYDVPYAGKLTAWRIYNLSINYSPTPTWQLSLRANNIKNSMPPVDVTQPGYTNQPFNAGNYNPFGRELFVEARYRFGIGGDR
ncbi:hypothetical protein ASG87_03770 [Frateuria sp. Soil773]|nr:hypothetical protein ASG87_03770 [Frateuria sp. Soil773]